ncbi:MAG: hypothetical protein ACO1TE_13525 [Prosthecobacter sp.]
MARQQQAQLTPKQQALQDLEVARAALAHHAALAAKDWNPKAMISHSIERHRMLWIGGAALAGLAAVRLFFFSGGGANYRRDNLGPSAKKSGLLALLLTPLLAYGRKAALNYGAQIFQSYLHQKVSPNARPPGRV